MSKLSTFGDGKKIHATEGSYEEPQSLELESWLPYRFSVIANRVSAVLEHMYVERFGLTVPGWRVMAALGQHSPLSAKELAHRLAMPQVAISRAISSLQSLGFISRRSDPNDRRKVLLRLSKKGAHVYAEIIPLALAIERLLLEDLSADERALIDHYSLKIMKRAEEALSADASWREILAGTHWDKDSSHK